MRIVTLLLLKICALSSSFPRLTIGVFLVLTVAGFTAMPMIKSSTNLIQGVGDSNSVINLTQENNRLFGEQDSLIVVLEFAEPPGPARLPFIKGLGEAIGALPGVRRVRYQFLDPEDQGQVRRLFEHFLLGMNAEERLHIGHILSPKGIENALRRTRNRLFLSSDPDVQRRVLEDPLELGQFVTESMNRRVGSVSLGDVYLLIASPDSTMYLIQITPDFASTDLLKGTQLMDRLRELIPKEIEELKSRIPNIKDKANDLNWYLTGKTAFHYESDLIFEKETLKILLFSFSMVMALLLGVYRSFRSAIILMIPICAGIGPNYGLIYLRYDEVNPVVMGASGVLFGLGCDYGVHLWGRFREEIDRGLSPLRAVEVVYEQTGPPVLLGGLTSILAFLCLCLSDQSAMAQFGWVGASGLVLTLVSTLFLFPALVRVIAARKRDYFPRMWATFDRFSRLFKRSPLIIVLVSAFIVLVSLIFVARLSYEKDLFKVFLARGMESMAVSEHISRKYDANFSQPTLLSFDVANSEQGLVIQRQLDNILARLMEKDREITSFDSISYLMAPEAVKRKNEKFLSVIVEKWPALDKKFSQKIAESDLSAEATNTMKATFDSVGQVFREVVRNKAPVNDKLGDLERTWYQARVNGRHRFLTMIRYSHDVSDMDELRRADQKILEAVKDLPVNVRISGPRQAMEAILSSLVSELVTLGLYVLVSVVLFFLALFRHPLGVALSLIPMSGAFCITLGVMGALGMGLPFSIVGVAPLIFGLGMDNGVHVVMGSSFEEGGSVEQAMARVTRPVIFTSLANVMGFVAMITSQHYSLEFLGWTMVIGMASSVGLTLTTLPALLFLMQRRRMRKAALAEPKSA